MYRIDLNSDIGESFGAYDLGMDGEVLQHVSSVNIACGWHAGDPMIMKKTVEMAAKLGVEIGAHPGLPDLMGFGRREMAITPEEASAYVMYQIGALKTFVDSIGASMQHVKPHGALYNMAAKDLNLARSIANAIKAVDSNLILVGLSGSRLIEAAKTIGLSTAQEVFADRAYNKDGSLVERSREGAVIEHEEIAVKRVIRMVKEGKVKTITGEDIAIKADTICIHGDNKKALGLVTKIKSALIHEEVQISPLKNFLK